MEVLWGETKTVRSHPRIHRARFIQDSKQHSRRFGRRELRGHDPGVLCNRRCIRTTSIGGPVGVNYQQVPIRSITHCYVDAFVGGESEVGGLVGLNDGLITECFAVRTVYGGPQVGGLVGKNRCAITDCWSAVAVNGGPIVGGLVGENEDGSIALRYAAGQVVGHENDIGALVGKSCYTFQWCHEVCDESGCHQECLPPEERERMVEHVSGILIPWGYPAVRGTGSHRRVNSRGRSNPLSMRAGILSVRRTMGWQMFGGGISGMEQHCNGNGRSTGASLLWEKWNGMICSI